ncbi:MAG TPA: hypothetical protein DEQ34_13520 [Balneolaceae bacterium]|nr:hypothetical protein [Balneolaceae bacterium]|tara:strand:- start:64352 stop:64720 length:369 start_codon:yes stop_codon:yes gene_type:complete
MEWSTVVFLGASMVSLVLLMGIIIFGTRRSNEYKEIEKTLGKKTRDIDSDTKELWIAFKKSEEEREKLVQRLQNLEAIVTSEAWESIQKGDESDHIKIHLQEQEKDELSDIEKAGKLAKRVR